MTSSIISGRALRTGPKGDKGDKGDPGNQGNPGSKGDPGAKGDTGAVPDISGKYDKSGGPISGPITVQTGVSVQNGNFGASNPNDCILSLEDTSASNTSYRQKFIYSSKNVGGGNDWLFRQLRPSDGAIQDFIFSGAAPGVVFTTGNFNPGGKLNTDGTIIQDVSKVERQAFEQIRDSAGRLTYFYGNPTTMGIYDSQYGSVLSWHEDDRPNLYGPGGTKIWTDQNIQASSKAINFRKKQFNVFDYGAVGNGDGSATACAANLAAFQEAIADIKAQSFGGSLVIPAGAHIFNSTLEDYNIPHGMDIEGGANSWIYFNGLPQGANGLGLGVTPGADGRIRLNGVRVLGRNFGGNTAGSLLSLWGSGEGGGVAINSLWINCDSTCLPVNHLLIKNPASSGNIRGINIIGGGGAFGSTGNTTGISVYSDRLATDVCFHDVYMQAVGSGFLATMGQTQSQYTLEGIAFKDCVLVGVQTGLSAVSGWYKAPGYSWEGGHCNAQVYCFRLDNISFFAIRNANAQLDINGNHQALIFATSCLGVHVSGNRFQIVDQLGTGAAKPDIAGVVAGDGCSMWSVTDNIFGGFTPGSACVIGQNGASGIYASRNKKFASGSTTGAMLAGNVIDDGNNAVFN